MALIEIDADEYRKLQDEAKSASPFKQFFEAAGANPNSRMKLLEAVRAFNPNIPIPALDDTKPVFDKMDALEKRIEEKDAEVKKTLEDERKAREEQETLRAAKDREEKINNTIESERAKLRSHGHTNETINEIEKIMQDRGLIDYEAAEALYERAHPKEPMSDPVTYDDTAWNLFGTTQDVDDSLLTRDRNSWKQWQKQEVNKFLSEKRAGTLRV
jgi:hypothetical protein